MLGMLVPAGILSMSGLKFRKRLQTRLTIVKLYTAPYHDG